VGWLAGRGDYNTALCKIAWGCFFVARFLVCVGRSSLDFVLVWWLCVVAAKANVLRQGGQKT
jgi:hypothetical protein